MKSGFRNLDDIASRNRGYKINPKKAPINYCQAMQSVFGARKFQLETRKSTTQEDMLLITLYEQWGGDWRKVGKRHVNNNEVSIHEAIKSLERKAKCKLYYVLLISTDGDYL